MTAQCDDHDDHHDDAAPCCVHDDHAALAHGCIDVEIDLPEVHPLSPVIVHLGLPTVTELAWSSFVDHDAAQQQVTLRARGQQQRDLGPPSACLIRTVRLQV